MNQGVHRKAQNAMEFLMTYGWAILIIGVVLGVLYQLGVFGGASHTAAACLVQSGYTCQQPILATNGLLSMQFGSFSQITITSVACTSTDMNPSTYNSLGTPLTMQPQQLYSLSISCPLSSNVLGTPFYGYLWITYNTPTQSSNPAYVGLVDLQATKHGVAPGPLSLITFTSNTQGLGVNTGTGTVTEEAPPGADYYTCLGDNAGNNNHISTMSWSADSQDSIPMASVGRQSSNVCSLTSNVASHQVDTSIAGLTNTAGWSLTTTSNSISANGLNDIQFTVPAYTYNNIVFFVFNVGQGSVTSGSCYTPTEGLTVPGGVAGCSIIVNNGGGGCSAANFGFMYECQDWPAGTYIVNTVAQAVSSNIGQTGTVYIYSN